MVDGARKGVPGSRLPAWMIAGTGGQLAIDRQRLRLAAYVYGNILVLAAIVVSTGKSIQGGEAALLVGVTALTTYVAHTVAHAVGQQLGRTPDERRPHIAHEVRDSMPIIISGVVPVVVLLFATLSIVPTQAAQLVAAGWVVGRLALIGFLVDRLSGRASTWRTLSAGLVLALVCAAIVVLKVLFAH